MASTRGRQVVIPLTNKSGGAVAAGDVVVADAANDTAFTTTTTGRYEGVVGVAQEAIASNATGRVLIQGFAALVNVPASVTRGHYIETHTVAKQATGSATRRSGSLGVFMTGGTTPMAVIGGLPDQTAGGSAGALIFLEARTASASATLDFTTFISSSYDDYVIECVGILPATDAADLRVEVGTGGGPTYDTTAGNYSSQLSAIKNDGTTLGPVFQNPGLPIIAYHVSNTVDYGGAQLSLRLQLPQSTTQRRNLFGHGTFVVSSGGLSVAAAGTIAAQYTPLGTALTALRFMYSTGNITSGTIRIYGIAKS